jgi:hypothetical protein
MSVGDPLIGPTTYDSTGSRSRLSGQGCNGEARRASAWVSTRDVLEKERRGHERIQAMCLQK